jgi:glyoxylase-like metal-dependent hydrolase (beta-lactamase superfamily II)
MAHQAGDEEAPSIDFTSRAPSTVSLDVAWIHGARASDPAIQVHHYDEHTVILRQSKAVHYEAPFMFLLFGNDRALLLDTGATSSSKTFPLRQTVDGLIAEWLAKHPREGYGLVVAHTHGHGDHVAADGQFADRPDTTIVARELDAVREFFNFTGAWPAETVSFDLGGRVLSVTGSPGHHKAAVTIYDPWSGILLTGDTVLPGRLYAFDYPAFVATLDRLVAFAGEHRVTYVFGCHVEMTNQPGRDYPPGARYQPDERPPQMTVERLVAVRDAARQVADHQGVHVFDDFIIYNAPGTKDYLRLMGRGVVEKIRGFVRP